MLTIDSIIAVTKQERTYGSSRHRFGQSSAPPRRPKEQPEERKPSRPPLRVVQDGQGRVRSYSVATGTYSFLKIIR